MSQLTTGTAPGGTAYQVDLAFDWDAGTHPTIGFYLLQLGLGSTGPASFANGPTVGDSLAFRLFDNSETTVGSGSGSAWQLENVEVWFAPTRTNQAATSPFGVATGLAVRPRSTSQATADSPTFGKSLPVWPLFPDPTDPAAPTAYRLEHAGRFFLSARVTISTDGESRVYRVDPEMIVGNAASGDDPEPIDPEG